MVIWNQQLCKAEEAARESRKTKQDRYAEMRRRKDEEREAQERLMVCNFNIYFLFSDDKQFICLEAVLFLK